MRRLQRLLLSILILCGLVPAMAWAKLYVATTTEDLAALAREVGGSFVEATPIARGYQDPHFVDAKPSYLLKLARADLFIQVGLELEVAWAPPLLTNARNRRILPGNPGFLDASEGCEILQKPTGVVDRSLGDVHPFGNPHYWLDPANGRIIAKRIAERLAAIDPSHAEAFQTNLAGFEARLTKAEKTWDALMAPLKGTKVVTYHNSWPNFAKRFGLVVMNHIEPKPGIPPSPGHIQTLTAQIKRERIPLLLVEPYFDVKLPEKIARDTGAKLVLFPPSVGAEPEIKTYVDLFDRQFTLLRQALGLSETK
ncbi:MAG: zinc ABC transporter substrate-binding protein [Elusimicrobia bacterium]|nr:zinc ABC transporter substrate-binding protein [Elusimicrobiota bacterium]